MKEIKRFYYSGSDEIQIVDYDSIADNAFENETTLKKIFSAGNIKNIGECAFSNSEKLEVFTSEVSSVKNNFQCLEKNSLIINNNILRIKYRAFKGCLKLHTFNMDIQDKQFEKIIIEKEAFAGCCSLRNVILSGNNIQIADNAFDGCPNVMLISNNDSVEQYAREHGLKYKK
jgi:hypothetical protein